LTVLDAYAVLAYLRDEPCADEVATLLRRPTVLTAANAAEVLDQLVRVYQRNPDDVHADIALLANAGVDAPGTTVEDTVRSAWPTAWPQPRRSIGARLWPRRTLPWPQWFAQKAGASTHSPTATASSRSAFPSTGGSAGALGPGRSGGRGRSSASGPRGRVVPAVL
jgi:hypothetical protein